MADRCRRSDDAGLTLAGRTILVIEDHPDSRELLTAVLHTLRAHVLTAESIQDAERHLALRRPDLIVCDMKLPDGTGLDFINWLRAKPPTRGRAIPCIAITGYTELFPPRLAQGFDAYMRKPLNVERFCAVAVAVARARQDSSRRVVLIVEDELPVLGLLTETLGRLGYDTHLAITATDAVRLTQITRPDVILLGVVLPDAAGTSTLDRLRSLRPDVPIIIVTATADEALARETLKRGAFEYVMKPLNVDQLGRVVEAALDFSGP